MAEWVRSSFCKTDSPQCVEVGMVFGVGSASISVRDSKLGSDSPTLRFTVDEWRIFIDGAKAGEFDVAD